MPKRASRSKPTEQDRKNFVEDVGMMFERQGQPRMAGRIVGHLLVCDPPEQSQQELAEALQASTGSISTMTRLLQQSGIVERVGVAGQRRVHFRLAPDAWTHMMQENVVRARLWRELSERTLGVYADSPPAFRQRLQDLHDITKFLEDEWPAVFIKWKTMLAAEGRSTRTG